jgi:translation initiation factor 1A
MPKSKPDEIERLYVPKEGEILGVVEQMFGFDRVRVRCRDGYVRNGRIRGKLRKRMWIREGDVIVVRPWDVQTNERADVMFRYTRTQVEWLRKRGLWE